MADRKLHWHLFQDVVIERQDDEGEARPLRSMNFLTGESLEDRLPPEDVKAIYQLWADLEQGNVPSPKNVVLVNRGSGLEREWIETDGNGE